MSFYEVDEVFPSKYSIKKYDFFIQKLKNKNSAQTNITLTPGFWQWYLPHME